MKAVELRKKSPEELRGLLKEKRLRAEALRALLAQHKTKNVKEYSLIRKDIARIKTLLREQRS